MKGIVSHSVWEKFQRLFPWTTHSVNSKSSCHNLPGEALQVDKKTWHCDVLFLRSQVLQADTHTQSKCIIIIEDKLYIHHKLEIFTVKNFRWPLLMTKIKQAKYFQQIIRFILLTPFFSEGWQWRQLNSRKIKLEKIFYLWKFSDLRYIIYAHKSLNEVSRVAVNLVLEI